MKKLLTIIFVLSVFIGNAQMLLVNGFKHAVSLPAQNKAKWSEQLSNAIYPAAAITVTDNQHNDFLGNLTMEKLDIAGGGAEMYQEVTVNSGTTYTVTFDAAGTSAHASYRVVGFSSCFCEMVAPVDYGATLTNTTSQVSFTVSSGVETTLRIYLVYNETTAGTIYLGRLWVRETGKSYTTTTTTSVD